MDKEDKFIDLKISPFQLPFLRDLGIKVVAMITFDLMYGPICYLRELSRSNFSLGLKEVGSLSEIYTGFARKNLDVVTSLDERIVIGRYLSKEDDVENVTILLFVCVPTADLNKLTKFARSLSEKTRGDPSKFDDSLQLLIKFEKEVAHKILISRNDEEYKGLTVNDVSVVKGTEFNNFSGFVFIQYQKGIVDGRFFPKIIDNKKVDLISLIKFVDTQKTEADLKSGEIISLYYKGLELLVHEHNEYDSIMVGAKKTQSRINFSYLQTWFNHFFNTYCNIAGQSMGDATLETLIYLDKNISRQPKKYVISEFLDSIIHSENDYPEITELPMVIKEQGYITLKKEFELLLENIELFQGDCSIKKISQTLSVPISLIVNFILFLKSRGFLEVYRKK